MQSDALIKLNNEKRKELNEENKKYYERLLLYVRLVLDKSEQETEEILMEMLDHILEAQEEGRTAADVFGDDPKGYANDIIGELPAMVTKKRVMYAAMGLLYFLGVAVFLNGFINTILYYGFNVVEGVRTYYLGSLSLLAVVILAIAFAVIYTFIMYTRWACFKDLSRTADYTLAALFGAVPFMIFLLLFYFMPEFGPAVTIPVYWLIVIGGVLYAAAALIRKKL